MEDVGTAFAIVLLLAVDELEGGLEGGGSEDSTMLNEGVTEIVFVTARTAGVVGSGVVVVVV